MRIVLVRHGEASAGWGDDLDPGLSERGRRQADTVARALAPDGPTAIVSSPLRRTRETAQPLADRWGAAVAIEACVAEIPSPTDIGSRGDWLRGVMEGTWAESGPALLEWRERLLSAIAGLSVPTVVFTHFVAINVVVGALTDDPRATVFAPANCSCAILERGPDGTLRLVETGGEAITVVN